MKQRDTTFDLLKDYNKRDVVKTINNSNWDTLKAQENEMVYSGDPLNMPTNQRKEN